MYLQFYKAQVIDNNDTKKLARIKVRLLPEMRDVQTKYLPWVKPFVTDGINIPEENDFVWVVYLDKYLKNGFYINDKIFLENLFGYGGIQSDLNNVTEIGNTTYPNLKVKKYADGSLEFHNTSNGTHGIYQSTGAYFIMDSTGSIYLKDKSGNKISVGTSGITLKTGDATLWSPNTIKFCPFTGAPHSTINKLKGG